MGQRGGGGRGMRRVRRGLEELEALMLVVVVDSGIHRLERAQLERKPTQKIPWASSTATR